MEEKNFKINGQGRRTELLTEGRRTQGRENSILNGYMLINNSLESVCQYSLPTAVYELPVG